MLGNDVCLFASVGSTPLARLAREYPGGYHTQIMNLLCSFVRNPPVDDGARDPKASAHNYAKMFRQPCQQFAPAARFRF